MPHPAVKGNIVGQNIRLYREKAGWDQVELAAEIEVRHGIPLSQRIISEIEQGKRSVRDKELLALAKALDVTPDVLFGL